MQGKGSWEAHALNPSSVLNYGCGLWVQCNINGRWLTALVDTSSPVSLLHLGALLHAERHIRWLVDDQYPTQVSHWWLN